MKFTPVFLLISAAVLRADTFTVTTDANFGPGSLPVLMTAAAGLPADVPAEINFDPAFFSQPRVIRLSSTGLAEINRTFTLNGPPLINGQPALTISGDVNGNGTVESTDRTAFRVLQSSGSGSVIIRRLTLNGCYRAVMVDTGVQAAVTMEDCRFTGNSQTDGSAFRGASLQANNLRRCVFDGNQTTGTTIGAGGAVNIAGPGFVEQCVFTGNTAAGSGAGLLCSSGSGSLIVQDCIFSGNSAVSSGSAVLARGAVTLRNCTLTGGNQGAFTAYGLPDGSSAVLENCTISGNRRAQSGSAVYSYQSSVQLRHCTITGNVSDTGNTGFSQNNGAIFSTSSGATVHLTNSVVAGNSGGSTDPAYWDLNQASSALITSGGGNLISVPPPLLTAAFSQPGDQFGTSAAPLDAMLGPLQMNGGFTPTCAPQKNSPAINGGIASAITTDQRGLARPSGSAPDSGAVEFKVLNFAQWAALYAFPAGQAGQNDDPDGDGARNLVEYFTGTDPLTASPSVLTSNLAAGQMRMTYPEADHVAPNIFRAAFQISQNLTNWNPSTQSPAFIGREGNTSRYEVFFNAGVPRRFARMVVEQLPPN